MKVTLDAKIQDSASCLDLFVMDGVFAVMAVMSKTVVGS